MVSPRRLALCVALLPAAGLAAAAPPPPTTGPTLHVTVDASVAPDLQAEGDQLAKVAAGEYPRLCRELASAGYTPIDTVKLKFQHIKVPAYTTFAAKDSTITLDVDWFHQHPDDLGCVVHELTHTVQHYALRQPPGWLTEGIADWTRWFVFEPANKRPKPNPDTANYDDSYRTTAAFLDWAQRTYNPDLVKRLNAAGREGRYTDALWTQLTGHPVEDLGRRWEQSLGGRPRAHVTIAVDTSKSPELARFAAKAKAAGEKYYPTIARMLPSDGYTPPTAVTLTVAPGEGVAATGGDHIECNAAYYKTHPNDVGSIIHELVHVVQQYTKGEQPGWLVEGIADYVRWFNWEKPEARPHANPDTARYDGSYQTSAEFLDWAQRKYDKHLVAELNDALRRGTYAADLWKRITGHTAEELGAEWKQSLRGGK